MIKELKSMPLSEKYSKIKSVASSSFKFLLTLGRCRKGLVFTNHNLITN